MDINEQAYFESVTENLNELLGKLMDDTKVSDGEIEARVNEIDLDWLYDVKFSSQIRLYRARYDENFKDDHDVDEYSYIHDPSIPIHRLRYNLNNEKVLYTASDPGTAFEEIKKDGSSTNRFYLSIWEPKSTKDFSYVCVYNPMKAQPNSNAEKFAQILKSHVGDRTYLHYYLQTIGELMEIDSDDYRFSSLLASHIFKRFDALISISRKSNGKEINLTFNKDATDKYLDLKYVLLCDVPTSTALPFFNVNKVGVNTGGRIVWYAIKLNQTSLKCNGISSALSQCIITHPNMIGPSSIMDVNSITNKMMVEVNAKGKGYSCEYDLTRLP